MIKRRAKYLILLLTALLTIVALPFSAIAADISSATFSGIIQVSNNGTDATDVSTVASINTTNFIDGGFFNAGANDTAIQFGGSDIAFMPGFNGSVWSIEVPSINQNALLNYILYNNSTGGKLRYFPGVTGMNVTDNATLELSDNFSVGISGFINDAGVGNLFNKTNSFYMSGDGAGNITASFAGVGDNVSPTGNASVGNWTNVSNSFDADNSTFASGVIGGPGFGNIIELTHAAINTNSIRYNASGALLITVVVKVTSANETTVFTGTPTIGEYATISFPQQSITQVSFQFEGSGATTAQLNEVFIVQPTLTASSVSTDEHTLITETDNNTTLFAIGVDTAANTTLPITANLTLNYPLHHVNLDGASFNSKDTVLLTANVTGAVWGTQGRTFDGVDDLIAVGHDANQLLTTGGTIVSWIRADSLGEGDGAAANGRIIHKADNSFSTNGYRFCLASSNRTTFRIDAGTTVFSAIDSIVAGDGNFYQAVVTFNGSGTTTFYINGVASGTPAATGNPTGITSVQTLTIGNRSLGTDNTFDGIIGEVRLYNVVLSAAEILADYNATLWRYDGSVTGNSNTHFTYNALSGVSVNDTANDWTIAESAVMPYMSSANITVDGVLSGSWNWEYGATFADDSVNSNTATPGFRLASSDPDVSATLLTWTPISQAQAPPFAVTTPAAWVSGNITVTGNFSTTVNATYPGADVVSEISTAGDTPVQFPTMMIAGVGILSLSLFTTWFLRKNRVRSLMFQVGVLTAALFVLTAMTVLDSWMVYLFLMIAIAVVLANNTRFAGTGATGNNLVGFLMFSFVGMTWINRILEGRFLQSGDVDIINDVLVFQPFSFFGLFTIPVPNANFLLNGIPALIRWDYGFFGGDAQVIQYLLYSITAVMSFILFVLALGAAYQMFSRGR